ncbi:hypothetical protein [Paracoccus sp. SSK6]|uniref:hypothetical protein n=1 Tax=Paracoccus sp. SSK6 TaxID=3143131 RepID=UPI00321A774C
MDTGASLLRCEALASRIDGILLADPDLARLWRMEAALLEAAASVGLEGERISTSGMVLRLTGALAIEEEARSTEMALRLLSIMKRPGDIFGSPVETIRRIEAGASPIGQERDKSDRLEDSELALVVREGEAWGDVPILAGLRASASYALRSRRDSPAAERLIFMAVEGAARHLRGMSSIRTEAAEDDTDVRASLMTSAEAGWIVTPSSAMTRNGLRIWSPLSGIGSFLEALPRALSQEVGHLGTLRHELARLYGVAAQARGRSRLADLAALLRQQPVVNSAMVCDRLGVSRRTALALIGEMVGAGCLVNVTSRRVARFWALPSLGSRMKTLPTRPARGDVPRAAGPVRPVALEETSKPGRLEKHFDERRLARVFEDLDAAMAGLDAVIRKKAEENRE